MAKTLDNNISAYKRKFYINLSIKGLLISVSILLSVFLFYILLESQAHLNSLMRTVLFYSYLLLALVVFYKLLLQNAIRIIVTRQQLSDEDAARNIGGFFPEIRDKLVNIVQLKKLSAENQLITASVNQKSGEIGHLSFSEAVVLKENLRYVKIMLVPFLLVIILAIISPALITEPARRIVQYKKEFTPVAPFQFYIANKDLKAFRNEDFELKAGFTGASIPSDLFLVFGERKIKLKKNRDNTYSYTFEKIQQNVNFQLSAAGFTSPVYKVNVVNRPNIKNFEVELNFPDYINKKRERLANVGNFQIPEGTDVKWYFKTIETNKFSMMFSGMEAEIELQNIDNQLFKLEKQIKNSLEYELRLSNQHSDNKDLIKYNIEVIKDKYPEIDLKQHRDTVMYNQILLGGQVADDYGLRALRLHYKVGDNSDKKFQIANIPIDRSKTQQSFYFQWILDSLDIRQGQQIEYYLSVSDNDGVNGSKTTTTGHYTFKVPDEEEVKKIIEKASKSSESQIDKTLEKSKNIKQELKNAEDRLKGKKQLNWQDESQLQKIIDEKQKLEEEIQKLKEQFRELSEMKERFTEDEEKNKRIAEKVDQLQKLMDELLDEETKKLYEELQKLLEENKNINDIQNLLKDLNQKEYNLEKELERSLELFKRLKYDQKLEESIDQSEKLNKEQEELEKETLEKEKSSEELQEKQKDIQEDVKELEQNIEEMNKINQDLKNPNPPADTQEEMEKINQSINESLQQLQENKNKKAAKAQEKAQQQMKKLSEKLKQMQSNTAMMSMEANLGDLRELLENLIKLSFEQESIMDNFRNVDQTDPKFLELSQKQLNIKDDAKIIEDSLLSLANRVFQIQSFVTREVGDMNKNINEAVGAIKERRKDIAAGKQQFAMTSMNNLALMLDDVMDQMQQAMADMMGNSKGDQQSQGKAPNISELQQKLGDQIKQLKESGKQGRQLSEELAKMAAEQERLRKMLEKMQQNQNPLDGKQPGSNLSDIMKKMEETELDLVNKKLTEQTIKRQQEIVTRLLEAEKSQRERELSEEREGEQAKKHQKQIPKEFEDYIKNKEQEVELLKTVPVRLNPYYKTEVNKYFNRLGNF